MSAKTNRASQTEKEVVRDLGRRQILAFAGIAALGKIVSACSSSNGSSPGADGGTTATGDDSGAASDAALGADADAATAADASGIPWATGGTASMTGKNNYPNPFSGTPATCVASCELTEGPCYSSQSIEIQDISYGYTGLPMRMYLQILDDACKPVAGALVDVWHVGPTGKYSGNDSAHENVAFCTGNDTDFTSHLYFRGKQTTDVNGIVYFDTCFPGWYASRTIHIHMTISIGGTAYVTTQLGFADTLDDEIVATQPVYKDRGSRDTLNSTDTVLPSTDVDNYLFETQKMTDGAMLAWKTLILRSSLSTTLCSPSGAGGSPGGGPGGEGGPGAPPGSDGG